MNTNMLPRPYSEPGMSEEQVFMREHASDIIRDIISASDFLSNATKILGYADNGIGAVICFVKSYSVVYALKLGINKNLGEIYKLHQFLHHNGFETAVNVYDFIDIKFQDKTYECMLMDFVDAIRASHIELSNNDKEFLFNGLGKIMTQLHSIPVEGYGNISISDDGNLKGKSDSIGPVLNELTNEVGPNELLETCISTFEDGSIKPVLTHHALGLHNVFFDPEKNEIKLFDFKSQLLPREFDLAMCIIWNRWLGEEYIDIFLDSYGVDNYNEDLLNKALYVEYSRKLETWYKRVKNNPKAQLWIDQGEKEIAKLAIKP